MSKFRVTKAELDSQSLDGLEDETGFEPIIHKRKFDDEVSRKPKGPKKQKVKRQTHAEKTEALNRAVND